MRLVVEGNDTSVVAIEDLRPFLEHGTLNVRLDAAGRVLAALREAATALVPAGSELLEADPVRQEEVAQIVLGVARAAGRLAAKSPDDPDAQRVEQALTQLGLST